MKQRYKKFRTFMGDFETTVYDGQTSTEVWASASVELYTEDVHIFHSIGEQFEYFVNLDSNVLCYYHNLKFDGTFWLDYLIRELHFTQACTEENDGLVVKWMKDADMPNNSIKYTISDMGQWYTITVKVHGRTIEIRDSLKLLPFSVKKIGKSFGTKHKKLDMEYKGYRYAGCEITEEEKKYIANDVLVVKEALEIMFNEGHNKLTIGSCCLSEYKAIIGKYDYKHFFPDLEGFILDEQIYGYPNADAYIRKSYRGGWCYLVKGKENQVKRNGTTADVNSLYPSMMSSESGSKYPTGLPVFWKGNYIPEMPFPDDRYFFVRIKTRFYLKQGHLPFIQIKDNFLYKSTESLESTDVYDKKLGRKMPTWIDYKGDKRDTRVTMTMTCTDYRLFLEHYDVKDFEILDGCYFWADSGIFDLYINKYKKIKISSTGAKRELAKLFLNNLYGKMATNSNSSFKVAIVRDETIHYRSILAKDKPVVYIPVGSAITSYARNFTIRAAQKNYYGVNERGFIYADTDSIHCDLMPDEIKGITVHPTNFCCWKLESCWDIGWFCRQKTYIEHVTHEDLQPVEKPFYNVKCAGMPQKCKDLFVMSMEGVYPDQQEQEKYTEEELNFLKVRRTIEDFTIGLRVPGKLIPKRIPGGTLLVDTSYEMR